MRLGTLRIISYILSFWVSILAFIRFLQVGKGKFLTVKTRDTPPPCLLDPSLGRHGYVKLKNIKLHYVMNGEVQNPLMVLVHGFPDFWFSWRHQLKEFYKEYCVVAVDLRGYGDSEKPANIEDYEINHMVEDIYQLITHFKGDKGNAVVLAHDWGGVIAYTLAEQHPEVVSKLIIGNMPHPSAWSQAVKNTWSQFLKSWYVLFFLTPALPEYLCRSEDLGIFGKLFRNNNQKIVSPDELEAYKYIYARPGAFTPPINYYRANISGLTGTSAHNRRVTVPTLLIWGDQDTALSTQSATGTSEYVDQFHLRFVHGASHWIQFERPEKFNSYAWNFLRST